MTVLLAVVCGVVGLAVGSFLNVVIHRLPRGESVVRPRSRCPECGAGIRPRDEVPVVSWLLLRGRCRDCGARISVRYLLVELLTAVVFVALAVRLASQPATLPAYLYLAAVGIALALIDLQVRRLPNALTLPAYLAGPALLALAAVAETGWTPLLRGLIGLAAMYLFYLLIALAYPQGMGLGDVKLAGVLGLYLAFLGWGAWLVGLFASFFLGGIVSIGLVLAGRAGRKSKVPYGPFMIAGALLAVLVGGKIASGYLHVTVG